MAKDRPGMGGLLKETVNDFLKDDCMDSAAALSYYTIFSLPAILVLLLMLVSSIMNPSDVRGGLEAQLQALYRDLGRPAGEGDRAGAGCGAGPTGERAG